MQNMAQISDARRLLQDLLLRHDNLLIRDVDQVVDKLNAMRKSGGKDSLHVIADFDMTLTKQFVTVSATGEQGSGEVKKERNNSSHAVLERGPHVSAEFAQYTRGLIEKYYPIEIDPSVAVAEKTKLMIEWWTAAHEAILKERITRDVIRQQAEAVRLPFREGCRSFIDLLDELEVPLLVFSAGLGDVIDQVLRVDSLRRDNQHIVSNHMVFDEHDIAVAFRDPLIHSLNKGEVALHDDSTESRRLQQVLVNRRNVLVVGDSPGDAKMADGASHEQVLKFGFFNFGDDARCRQFRELFDVVVTDDGSMAGLEALLQFIVKR